MILISCGKTLVSLDLPKFLFSAHIQSAKSIATSPRRTSLTARRQVHLVSKPFLTDQVSRFASCFGL